MNEIIWQNASTIFGGVFVAVLALAFIASRVMVSWKKALTEVKVADAEGEIYKKLSDRNEKLETLLGKVYDENKAMIQRIGKLEGIADTLAEIQAVNEKLKNKLDGKDSLIEKLLANHAEERKIFYQVINRKDEELSKQSAQIQELSKEVQILKLRLATDEKIFNICPHADVGDQTQISLASNRLVPGAGQQTELNLEG